MVFWKNCAAYIKEGEGPWNTIVDEKGQPMVEGKMKLEKEHSLYLASNAGLVEEKEK
jgi:hypothetical protein